MRTFINIDCAFSRFLNAWREYAQAKRSVKIDDLDIRSGPAGRATRRKVG